MSLREQVLRYRVIFFLIQIRAGVAVWRLVSVCCCHLRAVLLGHEGAEAGVPIRFGPEQVMA